MLVCTNAAVLPTVAVTAPRTPIDHGDARSASVGVVIIQRRRRGSSARGAAATSAAPLRRDREERADVDARAFEHIRAPEVKRDGRDLEADADDQRRPDRARRRAMRRAELVARPVIAIAER